MTHNDRDLTGKALWLLGIAAIPAALAAGTVMLVSRHVWHNVQEAIAEAYRERQNASEW